MVAASIATAATVSGRLAFATARCATTGYAMASVVVRIREIAEVMIAKGAQHARVADGEQGIHNARPVLK
jgi:hypothetical protein